MADFSIEIPIVEIHDVSKNEFPESPSNSIDPPFPPPPNPNLPLPSTPINIVHPQKTLFIPSSSSFSSSITSPSPNTAFQMARDRFVAPPIPTPKTNSQVYRPPPRSRENLKSIKFNIEEPTSSFTGRIEFLSLLHTSIQSTKSNPVSTQPQIQILSGTEGVGKTQTVRKYIQMYGQQYDNIIWINADCTTNIENSFRDLASVKLHLSQNVEMSPPSLSFIKQQVYDILCQTTTLIVFDNVDSLFIDEYLQPFLPHALASHSKTPFLLVVTGILDPEQDPPGPSLHLDNFSMEECLDFVSNQLNLDRNEKSMEIVRELAETLNQLPLALNQAIIYIKQQNDIEWTPIIENYITKFRTEEEKKALLAWPSLPLNLPSRIFEISWKVTWNSVRKEIQNFDTQIPELLSLLHPDKTPLEFLTKILADPTATPSEVDPSHFSPEEISRQIFKNLEILEKYGMLQLHDVSDYNPSYITMHRSVQYAIIEKLIDDCQAILILNMVIEKCTNFLKNTSTIPRDFLTCILSLHSKVAKVPATRSLPFFPFRTELARTLEKSGSFDEAWRIIKILYDIQMENEEEDSQQQKLDHSIILSIMSSILKNQKKFDQALLVCAELLTLNTKLFGPHHDSIQSTQDEIGFLLYNLGRFEDALKIYEGLYRVKSVQLGSDHPSSLATHHSMALAMQHLGRADEALAIYRDVHTTRDRLGSCDPSTLITLHNYALLLDDQGRHDEAIFLYQEMVQLEERLFGLDNPKTMATKNNMALAHYHKGDYEKAVSVYQNVFEIEQKIFGFHHPSTFDTYSNIADILLEQGHFDEAQEIYEKVYTAQKTSPGEKHPFTLLTKCKLAKVMAKQGRFNDAAVLYGQVYEQQSLILGSSHPSTLTTLSLIASVMSKQGSFEDSLKVFKHVWTCQRDFLGSENLETLQTLNNMGIVLDQLGRDGEAELCYKKVYESLARNLGPHHPSTLAVQSNLARVLDGQKKFDEALQVYGAVVKGQEKALNANHPSILNTKHNMAMTMAEMGRLEEAAGMLGGIHEIMKVILGQDHPTTLNTLDCLADVWRREGRREEAQEVLKGVYERRVKVLGEGHPDSVGTERAILGIESEGLGESESCEGSGEDGGEDQGMVVGGQFCPEEVVQN